MDKILNKEELYMLYVEEKKSDSEIAKKYNIDTNKIKELRKIWNININQRFLADFKEIEKMYKKFKYNIDTEKILQEYVGLPQISDIYIPILDILKDNYPHKIEEMWKIADKNYKIKEKEIPYCGNIENPTLYYRINWCIYKMLKENIIEKRDDREYQITEKGIKSIRNEETITPEEQYKKLKVTTNAPQKVVLKNKKKKFISRKINQIEANKRKINFGKFCEKMVYLREMDKIIKEGRKDLLSDIILLPEEEGDGNGYDIQSLEKVGNEYKKIYIEVKGTNKKEFKKVNFTKNEIDASRELKEQYYVCLITNAKKEKPEIEYVQGYIRDNFSLHAIQFEGIRKEK